MMSRSLRADLLSPRSSLSPAPRLFVSVMSPRNLHTGHFSTRRYRTINATNFIVLDRLVPIYAHKNQREQGYRPMTQMIFVNLPVRDLQAATRFYLAIGGTLNPQFSGEQSSSIMFSEAIGVMLLTHQHYRQFTARPIGDARRESQALLALTTA